MRALAIAVLAATTPATAGPVVIEPYLCGDAFALARVARFDGPRATLVELFERENTQAGARCGRNASPNACTRGRLRITAAGELEVGAVYLAKIRPTAPLVRWDDLVCSSRAEVVALIRIPEGVATAVASLRR